MCEFSHVNSYEKDVPYEDAIIGHRFFKLYFKEKELRSLCRDFEFTNKKMSGSNPDMNGDLGFYNYNHNYYYYYNNYNYYNNYDYNSYNYYSYNYYDSYNYKYHNYYILGITKAFNKVIIHNLGHRSSDIEIIALLSLRDHEDKDFLNYFNESISKIAQKLDIKVVPFQNGEPIPSIE